MTISTSLKGNKTDSGYLGAKLEIRRRVLGAISSPRVFDAFAGSGEMYRSVWCESEYYVGCDQRWFPDDRLVYVADNRRVMRCIDLYDFNVFDMDSYGGPWEQLIILARRRPLRGGESIGVVITEGSGLNLKMGGMPKALAAMSGLKKTISGGARLQSDIIDRAISGFCAVVGGRIAHRWQAEKKSGSAMRYIGLVISADR